MPASTTSSPAATALYFATALGLAMLSLLASVSPALAYDRDQQARAAAAALQAADDRQNNVYRRVCRAMPAAERPRAVADEVAWIRARDRSVLAMGAHLRNVTEQARYLAMLTDFRTTGLQAALDDARETGRVAAFDPPLRRGHLKANGYMLRSRKAVERMIAIRRTGGSLDDAIREMGPKGSQELVVYPGGLAGMSLMLDLLAVSLFDGSDGETAQFILVRSIQPNALYYQGAYWAHESFIVPD